MNKVEKKLKDLNIEPTQPLLDFIKKAMSAAYDTSVGGLSSTSKKDLIKQWFEDEQIKKNN
jgi:hypothetical protein